jgi:hypothetical protein
MKTILLRQWLRTVAIALLLLACASPAMAQDDKAPAPPFLGGFLKETRIVYPLRIGEWEAKGEHLYDQPELGASVRYRHRGHADRWIDLYFYPAGMLQPERLQVDTQRLLDELQAAIGQPGYYSEGDFDAPRTFTIALAQDDNDSDNDDATIDSGTIHARSAGMRLSREGSAYHSALVLLVHDLYYVKGRYSVEADALSRDETRTQLEAFMTEAVRATRITSSGDCGTKPVAGCIGAEPQNPVVPEGSREIRLEYRAPDGGIDSDRRLRSMRSALG